MPTGGCYSLQQIDRADFFAKIKQLHHEQPERLQSSIGYEQNAAIIERETGYRPPISREVTPLQDGDHMLVMRLQYRAGQGTKGRNVNPSDFDYFEGYYTERVPVPSYVDLLNMDIYEADAQRYINDLAKLTGAGTVLEAMNHTHGLLKEVQDGQDLKWKQLHEDYKELLQMHFDPEGYRQKRAKG